MELYRTKPDNRIVIVDETAFDQLEKLAGLNEKQIEQRSEEKFLAYVKESGISINFRINGAPKVIRHSVVTELNYDERGWPRSITEEIKARIVDDLTHHVNERFENYRTDCTEYVSDRINSYKTGHARKIKMWKYLFVGTLCALLTSCFYIITN